LNAISPRSAPPRFFLLSAIPFSCRVVKIDARNGRNLPRSLSFGQIWAAEIPETGCSALRGALCSRCRAGVCSGRRLVANEARSGVDCGRQLAEAHGPGEQIALALGATFAVKKMPLRFGLDAFGQYGHAEARAQCQHGA